MLKFGIVNVFPPARSALERLRLAERLGFDTFWICDSHVIWNECFSLMGWLLAQSHQERLELGTMVTNPISRDPIVVASSFATLQDLSGGRMLCGIGRGDSAVRVLKRRPATVAATELATTIIRGLASGEPIQVDGVDVQLEWASRSRLPVYVAAYGPKMLRVAGRVGDGVIIECADPHYIAWCLDHVRQGAIEAGRDPAQLSVICSTSTYVSNDLRRAREQVRPLGSVVGNHVAEVLGNNGPESMPPELAAFVAHRPQYDYLQHVHKGAEHSKYVPDEIIDRLCLIGSAENCVTRLRELSKLGVTHVNFYAQTDDYDDQMEIYAQKVIPQFRAQVPA
jgi:probable F420-dependent oxidoreductase